MRRTPQGIDPTAAIATARKPTCSDEPHAGLWHVRCVCARGVLRVWNIDTAFEQSLEGHMGAIYCLAQGGPYLFSGGEDTGVKTWQFANERFEPLIELKGHQHPVQVMKTIRGHLITADRGGTIAMWDIETGALKKTFSTDHTAPLMGVWVEDNFLFTGSLDGHVKVWDGEGNFQHDQVCVCCLCCSQTLRAVSPPHIAVPPPRRQACAARMYACTQRTPIVPRSCTGSSSPTKTTSRQESLR